MLPLRLLVEFINYTNNLILLIILLQHPFQIRLLIEYLPCELCIGNNPPVPIVLQGAGADIQPLAYFLAR